jgi:hypothetical protein
MHDWRDGQTRYLIHFEGGGSGMRFRDAVLTVGDELIDCGDRYRIVRVEQPKHERTFGHAWADRL